MLAFRKLFLALVVVTMTMAVASAQQNVPAFQCVANAGVPPIVRAEGLAELVGDLVLNCNNGTPTPVGSLIPQVNVQVFLNTNITSRLSGESTTYNEAMLMIDEPQPGAQNMCAGASSPCTVAPFPTNPGLVYKNHVSGDSTIVPKNIFQGRRVQDNSVVWLGVPIDAPGTTFTRIIRITNIRANANMLGTSSTLVPTQIVMFVSITGSTSIPINNPQQTVAWIQNGLRFRVYNADGDEGSTSMRQCKSNYSDLYTNPNKTDYGCWTGRFRFDEYFATAFKTRFAMPDGAGGFKGTNDPALAIPQNTPSNIYNVSESGFWASDGWGLTFNSPVAGQATQGTRLRVALNNVPTGVAIYVSVQNSGASDSKRAQLVTTAADGSGGYVPISKTGNVKSDCGLATGDYAPIPIFGGSGVAVWEVLATNPLAIEDMRFHYLVAYSSDTANNVPAIGTATANGSYAPISTTTTASSLAPAPRFADTSSAKTIFKINQCVSNLLFPFVTNQAGFNTGMVISNTTKDPYGTALQAGTCSINYYGDTNGGAAPPAQTSGVVPAGDYLAWDLMTGGKFGMTATPGFQGYVIAICRFQMAHGYAFISDVSASKIANGYLALILDSADIVRGTAGETLGQ